MLYYMSADGVFFGADARRVRDSRLFETRQGEPLVQHYVSNTVVLQKL